MIKKRLLNFFVFIFLSILSTVSVFADEGVYFSVSSVIPENQINKNLSYFDLKVAHSDSQELKVKIFNNKNHEIKVKAMVTPATTCRNGFISYTNLTNYDESLKYPLSDILKLDKSEYIVPPGGFVTATALLNIPRESYDGIILGGLIFTKADDNFEATNEHQITAQIENEYQYVVGVMLSENDNKVKANMNLKYIKPTLANYHTNLAVNLQNDTPVIIPNLKISGTVYKKGSSEVYKSTEKENIKMAPNSNFDFMVDWQNHKFQAGEYRVHVIAQNEEYFWEWDEDFTITPEQANDTNKDAVDIINSIPNWVYIFLAVLVLILVAFSSFVIGCRCKCKCFCKSKKD